MPFTYEYFCEKCSSEIEETRTMENRDVPAKCSCGAFAKRDFRTFRFDSNFIGSVRQEHAADDAVKLSVELQKQGFSGAMEREVALGQAVDRAKELGVPLNSILGSKPSPFKGDNYQPEKYEVEAQKKLTQYSIEADMKGDSATAKKHKQNLVELDKQIKQKSQKAEAKKVFAPDNSKADLKKMVIKSQRNRNGVAI